MTSSTLVPLIFFRIVAERSGRPSGLLLDIGDGDVGAALALLQSDEFRAMSGQFACLYGAGLDPLLAEALGKAQWERIEPGKLLRVDEPLAPRLLAPAVRWIDGHWCLAPPSKPSVAQSASRVLALQLVQLVAADADNHAIETLLRRDPTLSYNLLRLVNSLGVGGGRWGASHRDASRWGASHRITSFSQAILILGRQQLRRWLGLMLFAARQGDMRSAMLLARVALRARALELLAKGCGLDKNTQEQAFMTGMFSLLGVLFGMPLAELLAPLAISEAVQGALLGHEGELGALLQLMESAERADFDAVAAQLAALQVPAQEFNRAMIGATVWMQGAVRESGGAADA
jgi:hypothetical protein